MITCHQHDYIEIVCLYQYPIKLLLKSGAEIEGIASDTQRNASGEECIQIDLDTKSTLVALNTISNMQVTVENPHVQTVSFV